MATLITLVGTTLGFICAVLGVLVFGMSPLGGLALWVLSGPVSALAAVGLSGLSGAPHAAAKGQVPTQA